MKIGIVGVGFMGTTHAAGWAETPARSLASRPKPSRKPVRSRRNIRHGFIPRSRRCFPMWT